MSNHEYVHGYSDREMERLYDQANALTQLLHHDSIYPAGDTVLEAGCGVGAQTVILAGNNPRAKITSVDISPDSLSQARALVASKNITNVTFQQADLYRLPYADGSFDHVFVCFVLEHLADPTDALIALQRVLKPGGTLTAIEGDHGSAYFYPDSPAAKRAIGCLVELQNRMKGDSEIGADYTPCSFSRA